MRNLYFVILFIAAIRAFGDVKLCNVFGDNMVLQREMKVPVWGTAVAGEKVTVSFNGQSVSVTTPATGKWRVELAPMKASATPQVMTLTSSVPGFKYQVSNILIGDVWLCSGQSNMAFTLDKDALAATEIPNAANPLIRMLLPAWQSSDTPLEELKSDNRTQEVTWLAATPETCGKCSAVAYWFAKEIQKSTGVPVGLIRAAKGGSPIEAWLPKEGLIANAGGKEDWDNYQEALKVFPEKDALYQQQMKEWQNKMKGLSVEERAKAKRPNPPYGPTDGNHPCGLYYGSIHPFIPMAIKGVLWYQGESNACSPMRKAVNYFDLFTGLIRAWRQAWDREDLPFLFVQLPPFRAMSPTPEDSVWSRVRDAQTQTLSLPNTGMAIILDAGNEKDIHPTDKKPAGDRLAQWAKAKVYGMDVVPSGPLFEKMEVKGDKVVITFKHAGKGLEARDLTLIGDHKLSKDKLQGFTICGADKKFVWADAQITDANQVAVSCADVKSPIAVRYAWSSFPLCNLFNKDGFPASSFRTDTFEHEAMTSAKGVR